MSDYDEIVRVIQKSEAFRSSQTYQRLLAYLLTCVKQKTIPKETAIAMDVFGRDASFNPSEDTLVRVHMYKLRKKLTQYYEQEGAADPIRLQIPRGSYELVFDAVEESVGASSSPNWRWMVGGGILLLAFVGLLTIWLPEAGEKAPQNQSRIWQGMLEDEDPFQIVFGDIYVFLKEDSTHNKRLTLRDPAINTREDFQEFLTKHPAEATAYQEYPYSFLIKNSVFSLHHLYQLLGPGKKPVQLRLLSHFGSETMYDTHTIYVGLFKSMGLFQHYFSNSSARYSVEEGRECLQILLSEGDTILLQSEGNPAELHTDYGWFAKYPGPNDHTLMLFAGFHDTGVLQAVRYLTDPELIQQLEQQLQAQFGKIPDWFEVFFEVQGIDRTEIQPEIRYIFPIHMGENVSPE
ncbi:MAG: hypothetical protein AAF587_23645 [Bacteroidota bacterium]